MDTKQTAREEDQCIALFPETAGSTLARTPNQCVSPRGDQEEGWRTRTVARHGKEKKVAVVRTHDEEAGNIGPHGHARWCGGQAKTRSTAEELQRRCGSLGRGAGVGLYEDSGGQEEVEGDIPVPNGRQTMGVT